jgi:DNA-binding transcriptional LysR family regulator
MCWSLYADVFWMISARAADRAPARDSGGRAVRPGWGGYFRWLVASACINLRLPTHGGFYAWEFRKGGREPEVRVQGRVVFNALAMMRHAALDGLGLAYLPEDQVAAALQDGRLLRVLADWCPPRPGYHLYYPSRRQPSPAFALVVDALRHRA